MARSASHKPARVLLVRHGQTPTTGAKLPGRAPGLHLSDEGRSQAEATASRIGELSGVAAVYSSPMERAQETAAPIGEAVGREVTVEPGLNECDFGEWTGRRLADLSKRKDWRQVQRTPSQFRFPGGESFPEMQVRMVQTVEMLRRRHGGRTLVVVSHADTIKAAVAHALGTHLDLFQRIVISPCSVTALVATDDGPAVLTVNEVGGDLTRLAPS